MRRFESYYRCSLQMKGRCVIRVDQAAKKLGMNVQTLRLALQQDKFPFGVAVRTSEKRFTYYINENRLVQYMKGDGINAE